MNLYQKIRCKILVYLTHSLALPLLKHVRSTKVFPYSIDELNTMPSGSLGNDLANFLRTNNLQLLSHYARHDLKHIVLGFDTTEEGEFCLQAFMLGNGRYSIPVIITIAFGIFLAPEYHKKMMLSYKMGTQCEAIHQWNWYQLVTQPTASIKEKLFNKNVFEK